jgi:hypothetical protein
MTIDDFGDSGSARARATSTHRVVHERAETRVQGLHRWGIVDLPDAMATARSGIARYRLQVFPPGTNSDELRPLLLLRRWRTSGALGAFALELMASSLLPGWGVQVIILCAYVLILWYAIAASAKLRGATRRLSVARIYAVDDDDSKQKLETLARHLHDLLELDQRLGAGAIGEVEYEARWSRVYRALG